MPHWVSVNTAKPTAGIKIR